MEQGRARPERATAASGRRASAARALLKTVQPAWRALLFDLARGAVAVAPSRARTALARRGLLTERGEVTRKGYGALLGWRGDPVGDLSEAETAAYYRALRDASPWPAPKPNGLPDFTAYRTLPVDPDAGNPLRSYGAVWADRLGSAWTVPVELPLSSLSGLHPRIQTTARLASVRRARLAGKVLPPLELGVFRDGSAWIVDGNHRLVDARKAGLRTVWVRLTFVGA